MQAKHAILKTLLGDDLSHLSSPLKAQIEALPCGSVDWLQNPYPFLDLIDNSWLSSSLLALHKVSLTPSPMQDFAKAKLWQAVAPQDILPFQIAKQLPMGTLLNLSTQELIQTCQRLGLYDLVLDARHVVQTHLLNALKGALSDDQQSFYKKIQHQPSSVDFGRLSLTRWNKDAKALQVMLEKRGLNRLAKATFPAHTSIKWYLQRRLNQQLASTFTSFCTAIANKKAQKALQTEVETALGEQA